MAHINQLKKFAVSYYKRRVHYRTLLLFILLLNVFAGRYVVAQTYQLIGTKTFGGIGIENSGNIVLINNIIYISGVSASDINGDKTVGVCTPQDTLWQDGWILKIDDSLNIIDQYNIGGSHGEAGNRISESSSIDTIIVTFASQSDSSCNKSEMSRGMVDFWIYLQDANGNKIWDKTFGGATMEHAPKTLKIANNFYVYGSSSSSVSGDKTVLNFGIRDYWLLKLDSNGNKIWDKVYGGSNVENAEFYRHDAIEINNFNLLVVGNTSGVASGQVSDTSRGLRDWWIFQIDSAGSFMWNKRMGGDMEDYCKKIIKTSDNNFILAGWTESNLSGEVSEPALGGSDFWIVKIDSVGNKIWDRRYGGSGDEEASWIHQTSDGGYWIAGTTTSPISGHVTEPAYGIMDYWVLKIDSAGNKLWDKRFGGPGENELTSAVLLPDSSIMLFGSADTGTSAVKTDYGNGLKDYWIVHFKYTDTTTSVFENQSNIHLSLFPNPSKGIIEIPGNLLGFQLSIYDKIGKLVYSKEKITESKLDLFFLNNGQYTVVFANDKDKYSAQWIKLE